MNSPIAIFWHRRDLRLEDNAGLHHALKCEHPVLPLFIFDTNILDDLENKKDARVTFIYDALLAMQKQLEKTGSTLLIKLGTPEAVWKSLVKEYDIKAVFTNRDYEPYAKERDGQIEKLLSKSKIPFKAFKDHVIFEKGEIVKDDGEPYVVFTPYSKKWLEKLDSKKVKVDGEKQSFYLQSYPNERYFKNFAQLDPMPFPKLKDIGFERSGLEFPDKSVSRGLVKNYQKTRDYPAQEGTSRLSVHFRFGTVSIREKARRARQLSDTFLNELIWRDFYSMILFHFPHVVDEPFRKKYSFIEWRNNEKEFKAWCEGKTGYPLVDAGMRQLNTIGWMHNRVRMVVASFLTKHLLIDWRWGEAYFAKQLIDFELSSNNGGWQWAAGCGTDAAPYFRIFNPELQLKKFDPQQKYIKEWVPEYGSDDYPDPIVEHKEARQRCLSVYKSALQEAEVNP